MNGPLLEVARFPGNAKCAVTSSWDDNDRRNMEIMKILDSMNLKATFYVDPGNPKSMENGLTDSQLVDLAARHEVGSHTWSHLDMRRSDTRTVREELMRSKEYIESVIRQPVFGLAYPYGGYTPTSARIARDCGYLFARTGIQGVTRFPPSNPFVWGTTVTLIPFPRLLKRVASRRVLSRVGRLYATNLAWSWRRLALRLFEKVRLSNGVFHLLGHAIDALSPRLTRELLDVFRCVSLRDDTWYATNGMLFLNELTRKNVQINEKHCEGVSRFDVRLNSANQFSNVPIALRLKVPANWNKDWRVEVATGGQVRIQKQGERQTAIDIFYKTAEISVSYA